MMRQWGTVVWAWMVVAAVSHAAVAPPVTRSTWLSEASPGRLQPDRSFVYQPAAAAEWSFSHHPYLTRFGGRLIAMWSNARRDEDSSGQRVAWATSEDGKAWSPESTLVAAPQDETGEPMVLTAAGFHEHDGELIAYFGVYRNDRSGTRLGYVSTRDGAAWSAPRFLNVAVTPNDEPRRLASGKLMICGHLAFPTTSDPSGRDGWVMQGLHPTARAGGMIEDNPATFWTAQKELGWEAALCEGSFVQLADGTIRMMLRATGDGYKGRLWQTESTDDGVSWTTPRITEFPDNDSKFQFGRLSDGRYFYLGTPQPEPRWKRSPLVFSLSSDGIVFDRHWVIADEPYEMRTPGRYKGGEYGYAHLQEHDGRMEIICSRQKEAVEFLSMPIPAMKPEARDIVDPCRHDVPGPGLGAASVGPDPEDRP